MTREDLPHIQFYIGDWRRDVGVQSLSYHYRGIWLELLMLMHCSEQRGRLVLNGKPMQDDSVSRLLGLSSQEGANAIQVLLESAVASRDSAGALICRRMVREAEISAARKRAGSKGLAKRWQNPDIDIGNASVLKIRIGNLFRRRETTPWSEKEEAAFGGLAAAITEEDLAAVERYYSEQIPRDKDYRRRDLLTLLNNWTGEVDRARARMPKLKADNKPKPQPDGWLAWLTEHHPGALQKDYWRVPDSVREEFGDENEGTKK